MYLLYAPPEKFRTLPNGVALLTDEVKFYNNIAFCPKFYWRKYHLIQGCWDITPTWMQRKRITRTLNNILVIATGGYGDSMWAMPFIRMLRGKYPNSKILICTEEKNMPVWSAFPYADLCVKNEYWNLQNLIRTADEVFDFGGIATFLKKEMRLDPIEATFKTAGYDTPKNKEECRPHIVVTLDEGKRMEARLHRAGVDIKQDRFIVIALESSTANRNWPFIYVRALTERLIEQGYKVIWLSESKDLGDTYFLGCDCGYELTLAVKNPPANFSWKCPDCAKENITGELKQPEGVINWSGKTNVREAMAVIAMADCFVGPNSGLMVVSTALTIPTVGLFGAFNPKLRAKFYEKFIGLWGKTDCAPCNEHWTECHLGYPAPCMKIISVDSVHQAVLKLLSQYPRQIIGKLPIE